MVNKEIVYTESKKIGDNWGKKRRETSKKVVFIPLTVLSIYSLKQPTEGGNRESKLQLQYSSCHKQTI